jgi:muconate cycloisomerase
MDSTIASIDTFPVRYPVVGSFKFFASDKGERPVRDTVVVRITDDQGRVGWGQCVPSRTWSYETPETVRTTIDRYLAPAMVGLNAMDTQAIWSVMNREIASSFSTGQPLCKAGLDLALFDLTGRILRQPANERWQRAGRRRITLSWTVDVATEQELEGILAAAEEHGFHHFNIKVGRDPELDVRICRRVRRQLPTAYVWADANGGYDLHTALDVAPQFADAGIAALEQPFPANRLSWYARLRQQRALPVLMDEGIVSLTELVEFHQLTLLDGVALKVSRCGGLSEACRIADFLRQEGLELFASGLTDPDLSLAASLLLFGAYDLERPAALNAPQFLSGSILRTPVEIQGDQALIPEGVGLGVDVDEERVRHAGKKPLARNPKR